jgi:hypothetical protein
MTACDVILTLLSVHLKGPENLANFFDNATFNGTIYNLDFTDVVTISSLHILGYLSFSDPISLFLVFAFLPYA